MTEPESGGARDLKELRRLARGGDETAVELIVEAIVEDPSRAVLVDVYMLRESPSAAIGLITKSELAGGGQPKWLYRLRPDLFSREERWHLSGMHLVMLLPCALLGFGGLAAGLASTSDANMKSGAGGIGFLVGIVAGAVVYGIAKLIFFLGRKDPLPE